MSQFSTCIVSASLAFAVTISAQAPAPEVAQQSTTQRTAQLIGALEHVRKLEAMSASTVPPDRWQILWLHQCVYEKIMAASLQVDATCGRTSLTASTRKLSRHLVNSLIRDRNRAASSASTSGWTRESSSRTRKLSMWREPERTLQSEAVRSHSRTERPPNCDRRAKLAPDRPAARH